jgi:integrase
MTDLEEHLERYVALRRGLGYKLVEPARQLTDLLEHLDARGVAHLRADDVVGWASLGSSDVERSRRLSAARCFARYVSAFDADSEIPPTGLFPVPTRAVPYVFSAEEIACLLGCARRLVPPLWSASIATMLGLMAVTGIRPGEARRAGRGHLDLDGAQLLVADSKNGRSRLLPLHPSTVEALWTYLHYRDDEVGPEVKALFVDAEGAPISRWRFSATFRELLAQSGIVSQSGRRPPRAGDLRHSFAVSTLATWHAEGADVAVRLPVLSAFLGHARPANTYWYLEAAPELRAVVAERLARWEQGR